MPLSIILLLLILALAFYKSRPAFSFKCLLVATLLLFITALPPFSDRVMAPLENNYPVFQQPTKPIDYIIVLGCYHTADIKLPPTIQLRACSLQRLVEAVRIYRMNPAATIITSGSAFGQKTSNAQAMKQAALSLGVPEHKIITENFPKDTEEEAFLIAPRVIGSTSVLITNADHLPRAMKYFQQQGVNPIPAPASFWIKHNEQPTNWSYYIPTSADLEQTTVAWYESVGRLWQWLKSIFS